LGWYISSYNNERLIEHSGNGEGYSSHIAYLPESKIGFVIMTNVSITPLQSASVNLVFDTLLNPLPSVESVQNDFEKYEGEYLANFWQYEDVYFTFRVLDGKPALDIPGQTLYMLRAPDDDGKFYFEVTDNVAISFDVNDDGQVTNMLHHEEGQVFSLPSTALTAQIVEEDVQQAKQLFATMRIEERRNAYEQLGKVVFSGKVVQPQSGIQGEFIVSAKHSDAWEIYQDFGKYGSLQTKVTSEGGMNRRLRHEYELKGKYHEHARLEHPFNYLYWDVRYNDVKVKDETEEDGSIQVKLKGSEMLNAASAVDPNTGFVREIQTQFADPVWGTYPRSLRYSDYQLFCGLHIPRKFEIDDHETGRNIYFVENIVSDHCLMPGA